MIVSDKFFGRLGNNILQISNMIDIAITYRHNIKFKCKKLSLFNLTYIEIYFNKYNNPEILRNDRNFFSIRKMPFPKEIFQQNVEERNNILRSAFLIRNIIKLPENDLTIHIRSGDVFSPRPHDNYVPPPLSYYTRQIDRGNYDKIHIVCEDTKNPVVNELLKLYKNAVYEKNNLENDIRKILGSTNIIFSVGTFIPALILLSDNIKYTYGNACNNEELEDYYKFMKPWKNTKQQREYIITYVFKD